VTSYNGSHCALRRVNWQQGNVSLHSGHMESVHPLAYFQVRDTHLFNHRHPCRSDWVIIVCSLSRSNSYVAKGIGSLKKGVSKAGSGSSRVLDKVDEDSQVSSVFHGCSFISYTDSFPGKSKSSVGGQPLCWGMGRNNRHSCQLSQPLGLLKVQILGEVRGLERLLEVRGLLLLNCRHLQRHAVEINVVFWNKFLMTL